MFSTFSGTISIVIPQQNECFWGYTGISLSVGLSMYPSVYKILVSVSAGRGIKSNLVTALVLAAFTLLAVNNFNKDA